MRVGYRRSHPGLGPASYTSGMIRALPVIITVMLMIYCIVEVAQADADEVRHAPKWLWAVAVIALPLVGSLLWLFLGRPTDDSRREAQDVRFPAAPDDDEDFLRGLR